jgi:hypothetical protein
LQKQEDFLEVGLWFEVISPSALRQSVRAVFPHTAFRLSSSCSITVVQGGRTSWFHHQRQYLKGVSSCNDGAGKLIETGKSPAMIVRDNSMGRIIVRGGSKYRSVGS